MKKIYLLIFVLLTASVLYGSPVSVVPGVTLERFLSYKGSRQIINIARIDLTNKDIHVSVGLGDSEKTVNGKPYGKEPVSAIVEKHNALLGVNADFFILESFRDNLNFSMADGEIISEPQYNREVMFIADDNHIFFDKPKLHTKIIMENGTEINVTGINRFRNSGDAILFTDRFAPSTLSKYKAYDIVFRPIFGDRLKPNSQITLQAVKILPETMNNTIEKGTFILSTTLSSCPNITQIREGDIVTLDVRLEAAEDTKNVKFATGGGPRLIENGRIHITDNEGGFKADIAKGTAPRTAVGINETQSEMILVTVDGRCAESKGMTLAELAEFMQSLGVWNAMNFDGGGSTSMSIMGLVMNSPSEIIERNVANALLVSTDYKGTPVTPDQDFENICLRCGTSYSLPAPENAVWGSFGGLGYFSENMFHTQKKNRKGKIGYISDGIKYEYNAEISTAPLGNAVIEFAESEKTEQGLLYHCYAKLFDRDSKPMSFCPIFIYPDNGVCQNRRLVSDAKGQFAFDVLFYPHNSEFFDENADESVVNSLRIVFGSFSKTVTF